MRQTLACDDISLWVTSGYILDLLRHADKRENAILKFSLVDRVSEETS